jgi:hypothetical protein
MAEPCVPGPIVGARFWIVDLSPTAPALLASPRGGRWLSSGRPTAAHCDSGCSAPPSTACSCGIYAFHPWSRAFDPSAVSGREVGEGVWTIWGEVEAWGAMEVYEDGFRAQYARPASLFIPSLVSRDVRMRIEEVARAHQVPCLRERTLIGRRRRPAGARGLSPGFLRGLLEGDSAKRDSPDSPNSGRS